MSEARLIVARAGPSTTIQGAGRPGFLRYGIPASGPMDRGAWAAARARLEGAGEAGIEIGPGGLALEAVAGAVGFAIAGGFFRPTLAGRPLGARACATLNVGERLVVEPGPWGSWAYLAFAGEIAVPPWLGSRATHAPSGLGGAVLKSGDRIAIARAQEAGASTGDAPWPARQPRPRRFRIVIGPQADAFPPEAIDTLLAARFHLSHRYDRMGYGLDGPALTPRRGLDLLSEPIVKGSIQVQGDGRAAVLMADHQSSGGYPKIATLIGPDQDAFAQLRPGDPVRFVAVNVKEAVTIARQEAARD